MSTYFFDSLPGVYKNNLGGASLANTADSLSLELIQTLKTFAAFLDPESTSTISLDFIADTILDLSSWFWSYGWSDAWKRQTIQNYPKLVKERGNKSLIPYLFNLYGLNVQFLGTGWVLNASVFPVTLSTNWDQLVLKIPINYTTATPEYKMIQMIIKWFIPDLISVSIQY